MQERLRQMSEFMSNMCGGKTIASIAFESLDGESEVMKITFTNGSSASIGCVSNKVDGAWFCAPNFTHNY